MEELRLHIPSRLQSSVLLELPIWLCAVRARARVYNSDDKSELRCILSCRNKTTKGPLALADLLFVRTHSANAYSVFTHLHIYKVHLKLSDEVHVSTISIIVHHYYVGVSRDKPTRWRVRASGGMCSSINRYDTDWIYFKPVAHFFWR